MQGSSLRRTLAFVKQVSYDRTVLQRAYPNQVCSIARSLEVIGERWTLLILRDAVVGLTRFEEFQASLASPPTSSPTGSSGCPTRSYSNAFPTRIDRVGRSTCSRTRDASSPRPDRAHEMG